jgi:hypothetical protein
MMMMMMMMMMMNEKKPAPGHNVWRACVACARSGLANTK